MAHRNMTCRNVEDHLGNEEGIETRGSISLGKIHNLFLESNKAADTTTENNANPVYVYIVFVNTCISYGLIAGYQCGLCKTVEFAGFLFIEVVRGFKSF